MEGRCSVALGCDGMSMGRETWALRHGVGGRRRATTLVSFSAVLGQLTCLSAAPSSAQWTSTPQSALTPPRIEALLRSRGLPPRPGGIEVAHDGGVGLDFSFHTATNLCVLRGLRVVELNLTGAGVADIGCLGGMQLQKLCLGGTQVSDLTPLRGMPLSMLNIVNTRVHNLRAVAGLPLRELAFDPETITQGMEAIRSMKGVVFRVHGMVEVACEDFWSRYDAGEFAAPKAVFVGGPPEEFGQEAEAKEQMLKSILGDLHRQRLTLTITEHSYPPRPGAPESGPESVTAIGSDGTVQYWKADRYSLCCLQPQGANGVAPLRLALSQQAVAALFGTCVERDVLTAPSRLPSVPTERGQIGGTALQVSIGLSNRVVHSFEVIETQVRIEQSHGLSPAAGAGRVIRLAGRARDDLQAEVQARDAAFLTDLKLEELCFRGGDAVHVWLELRQRPSLWGETVVRLSNHGDVQFCHVTASAEPRAKPEVHRGTKRIAQDAVVLLFGSLIQDRPFGLVPNRVTAAPDEVTYEMRVQADVDGQRYSRTVRLLAGEARETPRFRRVFDLLRVLGSDLPERSPRAAGNGTTALR
jgi:hypothetical protein